MKKDLEVIIADDDEIVRKMIELQLKNLKINSIQTAPNGEEALEKICENTDIVFTDLQMENIDGIELTKAIRSNEKLKHIIVIMITAEYDPEIIKKIMDAGVNDILHKPYTFGEFSDTVVKNLINRTN